MASETKKNVESVLNDLIQICKDAQLGFVHAAEHVTNPSLKSMFLEISQQRSMFAGELQQEVMRLGGDPETAGSTMGSFHRGWIDFKSKITGKGDSAVVNEVEAGEDSAVKAYEKADAENLPGDIHDIVSRQYNSVLETHSQIRALKMRTSGGAA